MSSILKVGVIGVGFGQQAHVPAFRADPRCRIVAISAGSMERAESVANRLGIDRAYGDWRNLVSDPELDIVSIAVPPNVQVPVVIAAAQTGKAVFCEKPIATDASSAHEMLEAVSRAGVAHAVDFLFPEIEEWRQAKSELESGRLRRLLHAAVSWKVETRATRNRTESWKRRADLGGGTLHSFVSHTFYYLEWLLGPITAVEARLSPRDSNDDVRVYARLEHESGCETTISVATDACLGSGHRIEVYGDEGALLLENGSSDYGSGFRLAAGSRDMGRLLPVPVKSDGREGDGRIALVGRIVQRFVTAVLEGGEVTPNLSHGVRVQELIEAVRRSNSTGLPQDTRPECVPS